MGHVPSLDPSYQIRGTATTKSTPTISQPQRESTAPTEKAGSRVSRTVTDREAGRGGLDGKPREGVGCRAFFPSQAKSSLS